MRAPSIRQVVYASRAVGPQSSEGLAQILGVARARNPVNGITGMLLYRNGEFLQVLEGPPAALEELLVRLERDPRHDGVAILMDNMVAARAFGAWSMAFEDISSLEPDQLVGFSEFLTKGFSSVEGVRYPNKALKLLLAFRDTDLARV